MRSFFIILALFPFSFSFLHSQKLPQNFELKQVQTLIQNGSDTELKGLLQQAKIEGYSKEEVRRLLKSQGATVEQIKLFEELWDGKEISTISTDSFRTNFGRNRKKDVQDSLGIVNKDMSTLKRFGEDFFLDSSDGQIKEPELYLASRSSYQLGPGDELTLNIFGASEYVYSLQISPEGFVIIENLGPIFLSGLTLEEAENKLSLKLKSIYNGIDEKIDLESRVYLSLSLLKGRSILINITGQVYFPGAYTLSAFATIVNSLYAAGGPNKFGSFRSIEVLREGKIVHTLDLYEFFTKGKFEPFTLRDQDVIFVPPYKSIITLGNGFKISSMFEIRENETVSDVLRFSGGFSSNTIQNMISLQRVEGPKRISELVEASDFSDFILKDGDVLNTFFVRNITEQSVFIRGAVYVPGEYSSAKLRTIGDLLSSAGGVTAEAYAGYASLNRIKNGLYTEVVSINLNDSEDLQTELKSGDELIVYKNSELYAQGFVSIEGEVNSPGYYPYKEGLNILNLILEAGGLTEKANTKAISLYYNSFEENRNDLQEVRLSLSDKSFVIPKNSLIVVRKVSNYQETGKVYLQGLVSNEGNYALKNNEYRLLDLFKDAGGILKDAYLDGISIKRPLLPSDQLDSFISRKAISGISERNTFGDSENSKTDDDFRVSNSRRNTVEFVTIGINGNKLFSSLGDRTPDNIVLKDGDTITVPKLDNTIAILGEVQKETIITYQKSMTISKAIKYAGGMKEEASRKDIYVVYKNGSIKSRSYVFGLIRRDPDLEPGSKIIVTKRKLNQSQGFRINDLIGVSSSLATLVLLLRQLGL